MKATRYLIAALVALCFNTLLSFGQAGMIRTIAGGGTSTADGIPATAAQFAGASGIATDAAGNIYISDEIGNKIKKVNAITGVITTVAGTGTLGYTGDGGLAINAQISNIRVICLDGNGNLYLGDWVHESIRKINALTGIITTVAGGGSIISAADGVAATSALLGFTTFNSTPTGNIIVFDNAKIRKVDAITGLLSTLAGGGSSVADGIPATSADLQTPIYQFVDNNENIYFINVVRLLRKIDASTGLITTIGGGGTSTMDGIPAINFNLNGITSICKDVMGNILLMDSARGYVRKIDALTGVMNIIAGGGTSTADNVLALNANLSSYHIINSDNFGNIYATIGMPTNSYARKINNYSIYANTAFDSFTYATNNLCNGPELTFVTPNYIAGRSIKTYFGDGTTDSSIFNAGFLSGAYASVNHSYAAPGVYQIKHILFNGTAIDDSVKYNYTYTFCRTLPIKLYADVNGNCIKDTLEPFYQQPSFIRVDSNNITVDTLSVTSGFSYNAYSISGDIYRFSVISSPGGITATCPSIGSIADTIQSSVSSYAPKYFGLSCAPLSNYDLSVQTVMRSGARTQEGHVYVSNSNCLPINASVTLNCSPAYAYSGFASPSPTSYTSSSITWDLIGLAAADASITDLHYVLNNNPATGYLVAGDTVRTYVDITPVAGDANPLNNSINILDTVRASYDPNFIKVLPAGCITSGTLPTQLQYTIHFENTGTDTAHNIYVLDTLPAYVNPNTLRILMASAAMDIDIQRHDGYSVVRFDFPNINLLDTSHHGECDAAFIYTINTNAGLVDGTDIMNRVGIYFDYNSVVMTNEAHNNIGGCWPTAVATVKSNTSALPYPNPVANLLHIDVVTPAQYTISNIVGKPVQQGQLQAGSNTLQVGTLPGGVYLVSLIDKDGVRMVYKIVKE